MCRGSTDPSCVSYDDAIAGHPAIPYSAIPQASEAPLPFPTELRMLSPIGHELFQPVILFVSLSQHPFSTLFHSCCNLNLYLFSIRGTY